MPTDVRSLEDVPSHGGPLALLVLFAIGLLPLQRAATQPSEPCIGPAAFPPLGEEIFREFGPELQGREGTWHWNQILARLEHHTTMLFFQHIAHASHNSLIVSRCFKNELCSNLEITQHPRSY